MDEDLSRCSRCFGSGEGERERCLVEAAGDERGGRVGGTRDAVLSVETVVLVARRMSTSMSTSTSDDNSMMKAPPGRGGLRGPLTEKSDEKKADVRGEMAEGRLVDVGEAKKALVSGRNVVIWIDGLSESLLAG